MTAYRLSTWVRLALLAAAAGTLPACVTPARHGYEPAGYYESYDEYYEPYGEDYEAYGEYYDYWYYPAIGAYYDPRISIYFYQEHDHWVRARDLPGRYRPYLGSHVSVRSPHDRPYEYHARHRERYTPKHYSQDHRNKAQSDHRNNDVRGGAPRQPPQERARDDRRKHNSERDRNGNDQARNRDSDRHAALVDPRHKAPAGEVRKEKARDKRREGDEWRSNGQNRNAAPVQQQHRERGPEAQQQSRKARNQEIAGHRKPSSDAMPIKQQGKTPARGERKETAQNDNRKGAGRRDGSRNNGDELVQQRARGRDQPQDDYR